MKITSAIQEFLAPNRPMNIQGTPPVDSPETSREIVEQILKLRKGMITNFPAFSGPVQGGMVDMSTAPILSGSLSEAAFEILGAESRTLHPTHSWIVTGRSASMHVLGHQYSLTPNGMGSPLTEVTNFSGAEMLINASLESLTVIEAAEEAAKVPYAVRPDSDSVTLIDSSGREKDGTFVLRADAGVTRNLAKLKAFLEESDALLETNWGFLVHTRAAYDRLNVKLKEDPLWLLE